MKYCKDCKYCKESLNLLCASPHNEIDCVTGEVKRIWCHVAREYSCLCGEEANWFEPKDPPKPKKKWWQVWTT